MIEELFEKNVNEETAKSIQEMAETYNSLCDKLVEQKLLPSVNPFSATYCALKEAAAMIDKDDVDRYLSLYITVKSQFSSYSDEQMASAIRVTAYLCVKAGLSAAVRTFTEGVRVEDINKE